MGKASIYHTSVDLNQKEIVKQLRKAGITVMPVNCVKKFCDIIVGYKDKNYLFEIKNVNKKLTEGEQKFHDEWNGQVSIVYSLEDILDAISYEYL